MEQKKKVFVIMPFDPENLQLFDTIRTRLGERYEFSHAGVEDNQQNILADIVSPIYEADIIIADLTGLNPNVMYELGVAHSLSKKTIMITRDDLSRLPFDIKQYRTIGYSTHFAEFEKLIQNLEKNINGAIDRTVEYGNPVSDFLHKKQTTVLSLAAGNTSAQDDLSEEKGFLDFLADIETDSESMTSALVSLSSDMSTMSNGTIECTTEIERIKNGNSKKKMVLIKIQTNKVANYICTFSTKLREKNSEISHFWKKIEQNLTGLIDNDFATQPGNLTALIQSLDELPKLKEETINSRHGMETFKNSLQNIRGIENKLNQAICSLENDLLGYLSVTDQICASIDRIEVKSRHLRVQG